MANDDVFQLEQWPLNLVVAWLRIRDRNALQTIYEGATSTACQSKNVERWPENLDHLLSWERMHNKISVIKKLHSARRIVEKVVRLKDDVQILADTDEAGTNLTPVYDNREHLDFDWGDITTLQQTVSGATGWLCIAPQCRQSCEANSGTGRPAQPDSGVWPAF